MSVRIINNLCFGHSGLVITKPLFINSNKMFSLKIFLKNSASNTDNTSSSVWVNTFPHIPLTNNVIGSSMGNGKGKLSIWYNSLSIGVVFIELKNLRKGRSTYFLNQAQNNLNSKSNIIFCGPNNITLHSPVGNSSVSYQAFW